MGAGAVTGVFGDAVFTRLGKFPARRRPLLINRTAHVNPRFTPERHATDLALVGAAHAAKKRADRLRQFSRDQTPGIIGFRPVKRDTKKRTTGTARQAFITHRTPALNAFA